jgi:hypothetical protein
MPIEPDPTPASAGNPSLDVDYDPPDEPRFAAIISLRGEHDMASNADVSSAIGAISGSVLVDFSDCDFIDSTSSGPSSTTPNASGRAGTPSKSSWNIGARI